MKVVLEDPKLEAPQLVQGETPGRAVPQLEPAAPVVVEPSLERAAKAAVVPLRPRAALAGPLLAELFPGRVARVAAVPLRPRAAQPALGGRHPGELFLDQAEEGMVALRPQAEGPG